jgi:anthranilate/para-aminobenzoate synthase component I
MILCIPIADG